MWVIRTAEKPTRDDEPEWLKVIRKANEIDPGLFGNPETGPWWAGGTVEEHPDARVIFIRDGSVRIAGKTERGNAALKRAGEALGIYGHEDIEVIRFQRKEN